jgi:hypothetical protein
MYFNVFALIFSKLCRVVAFVNGTRDKILNPFWFGLNTHMHTTKTITINGRTYSIPELLRQVSRSSVTNLQTGRINRGERRPTKYSIEERAWQAGATIAQIEQRYGLKEIQAKSIQWKARQILTLLDVSSPLTEKDSKQSPT